MGYQQDPSHADKIEIAHENEEEPFPLTEMDKIGISAKDEDFEFHTWDFLKEIIATNQIDVLQRKPSDLRRYMSWCRKVKIEYGSVSDYIMRNRLPWGSPPFAYLSSIPFSEPDDYKILINDWPYGFTDDITHVVVWSKIPIPTDEKTGDLTNESRQALQKFVDRTFVQRLNGDRERVLWFKNWVHLQSVRALEHFHVLVRHAEKDDLEYWTGKKL